MQIEMARRLALGKATVAAAVTALSLMGGAATALADGGGSHDGSGDHNGQNGGRDGGDQGGGDGSDQGGGEGSDGGGGGGTAAGGNLYAATNAVAGNAIRVFHRSANGQLTLVGDTPTGGTGSGAFEQSANGVVLGGLPGESSPNNLTRQERFLFATNTGSDSVTVFRTAGDRLIRTSTTPTGGNAFSVTVNHGIVYVLNGGTAAATGVPPTITGFRLSSDGTLTPIPGSTLPVAGGPISGAAQISFNPDGRVLVVTEKQSNDFSSYTVDANGLAHGPIDNPNAVTNSNGTPSVGPFGFTYTRSGNLLTSENFGGAAAQGGAASFAVNDNGAVTPNSPTTVGNGQSDTCWFVVTNNQRYGFATNAQSNDISSYRIDPQGKLTLLNGDAAHTDEVFPAVGPTILPGDITLSRDSKYLYERNVMDGDVNAYAVGSDGSLTLIQRLQNALPTGAIGVAGR